MRIAVQNALRINLHNSAAMDLNNFSATGNVVFPASRSNSFIHIPTPMSFGDELDGGAKCLARVSARAACVQCVAR